MCLLAAILELPEKDEFFCYYDDNNDVYIPNLNRMKMPELRNLNVLSIKKHDRQIFRISFFPDFFQVNWIVGMLMKVRELR